MSAPNTIAELRERLTQHRASRIDLGDHMRQAAVAAILREGPSTTDLLFIRRAEHPKDPWSGHMAFPGGRVDPEDASPFAAALRETREEVGVDLPGAGAEIGRLSHVQAIARGGQIPLVIVPFVFELRREPARFALDPSEVQEALWVPFEFFLDESNRSTMSYRHQEMDLQLPCYHWEGRVIWGLTLRMLDELLTVARR